MRPRFAILAVLFVLVPIVEIWFLIQVGQVIGPWWTVLLLVAAGVLGSLLVRREGRRAWQALTSALREHRLPHRELTDAALILVGGTLLVAPGFVTDLVGAFCILPVTRPLARRVLSRVVARRLSVAVYGTTPDASRGATPGQRRGGPDVVSGEVVD